jgi:hypothetical protein
MDCKCWMGINDMADFYLLATEYHVVGFNVILQRLTGSMRSEPYLQKTPLPFCPR